MLSVSSSKWFSNCDWMRGLEAILPITHINLNVVSIVKHSEKAVSKIEASCLSYLSTFEK